MKIGETLHLSHLKEATLFRKVQTARQMPREDRNTQFFGKKELEINETGYLSLMHRSRHVFTQ